MHKLTCKKFVVVDTVKILGAHGVLLLFREKNAKFVMTFEDTIRDIIMYLKRETYQNRKLMFFSSFRMVP